MDKHQSVILRTHFERFSHSWFISFDARPQKISRGGQLDGQRRENA
jgi:hypothetical protein